MSGHVLVSPLGRSPGAVSGVVRALQVQEGIYIDCVITVGTLDPHVVKSQEYLKVLLKLDEFDADYQPIEITDPNFQSINPDSAEIYFDYMRTALESAASQAATVHLVTTAGSSGMGALAVLATNFYGADQLWHYWIPESVARTGTFGHTECELQPYRIDPFHRSLNPFPDGPNSQPAVPFQLHPIPRFINLKPLTPIISAFEGSDGTVRPNLDSVWYHLATLSGFDAVLQAFMDIPLNAVKELVALAPANWLALSELEQLRLKEQVNTILLNYAITAPGLREKIFEYIETGGTEDDFQNIVGELVQTEGRGGKFLKTVAYDLTVNLLASIIYDVGKRSLGIP